MKQLLQKILFWLSKAILEKYRPKIVGITGSIGKSSTKEAVFAVASEKFRCRQNIKNYNNEIGLPLTIIGEVSPGRSLAGWLRLFAKALKLIVLTDLKYPEMLILEMGADQPGDMAYLVKLAPTDIGIVTNVGPVHLSQFKTIDGVAKEKSQLIKKLRPNGWAILNADNKQTLAMKNVATGRFLTFGFGPEASIRALEPALSYKNGSIAGISFKLSYDGKVVPVFLPNVLAEHLINAALAAAAVGIILEMNLLDIAKRLEKFQPPLGRMRLLAGIGGSMIIDDTYNASPESTIAAIKVLDQIEAKGRKFAVLGDMLELGDYEVPGHQSVGRAVAKANIDCLATVGECGKIIAQAAQAGGMNAKQIVSFENSKQAGEWLLANIKANDLILVKGSQGKRMEKAVKIIMADPAQAKELIVRQDAQWEKK